jgi:hypothetical protein
MLINFYLDSLTAHFKFGLHTMYIQFKQDIFIALEF